MEEARQQRVGGEGEEGDGSQGNPARAGLGVDLAEATVASRKYYLREYARTVVWPRVRRAEAQAWWDTRKIDPDHALYNSWNTAVDNLYTAWEDLGTMDGDPGAAQKDWEALVAWAQLRILGRFDRGRYPTAGAAAVPCALCTKAGGRPGPPETAAHLLTSCPETAAWVASETAGSGELGAVLSHTGARGRMVRLVGRIARAVRGAAGSAEAIEARAAWDEWLDDGGLLGLLEELASAPQLEVDPEATMEEEG